MDLKTTQNNVVVKLPLLKQGDYEMWKLRIEQYFQVQDYALWEVIEYGNSFKPVARTTTNADMAILSSQLLELQQTQMVPLLQLYQDQLPLKRRHR
ncbi:hypothetical protein Tco_0614058, partial [Tanacetum coccineum]